MSKIFSKLALFLVLVTSQANSMTLREFMTERNIPIPVPGQLCVAQVGDQCDRNPRTQQITDNRSECWFMIYFQAALALAIANNDMQMVNIILEHQLDSTSRLMRQFIRTITNKAFLNPLNIEPVPTAFLIDPLSGPDLTALGVDILKTMDQHQSAGENFVTYIRNIISRLELLGQENGLQMNELLQGLFVSIGVKDTNEIAFYSQILLAQRPDVCPLLIKPLMENPIEAINGGTDFGLHDFLGQDFIRTMASLIRGERTHLVVYVLAHGHWTSVLFYKKANGKIGYLWMDSLFAWAGEDTEDKGSSVGNKQHIAAAFLNAIEQIQTLVPTAIPVGPNLETAQRFEELVALLIARTKSPQKLAAFFGEQRREFEQKEQMQAASVALAQRLIEQEKLAQQERVTQEAQSFALAQTLVDQDVAAAEERARNLEAQEAQTKLLIEEINRKALADELQEATDAAIARALEQNEQAGNYQPEPQPLQAPEQATQAQGWGNWLASFIVRA